MPLATTFSSSPLYAVEGQPGYSPAPVGVVGGELLARRPAPVEVSNIARGILYGKQAAVVEGRGGVSATCR